jgi:hypothetical protein
MLSALIFCFAVPAADYHWPLDLEPKQLSSSFGEYRSGRLHAGIDLRTAGTGRSVYAAESGEVTRVRVSPWGYGKAVYVKLVDGNTAIYAHLESFDDPIGEYVRRAQHSRRSYSVDLYPSPGDLPVARGQVIAKSGQTGVGVPHLHYEIRDPANRPINPRDLGIDWPDDSPPAIEAVLIAPLTAGSRVNGDVLPVIVPAQRASGAAYTAAAITAHGVIGFGIQAIDPANNGASKLGLRTLATSIDGVEQFRMTRDRLSYDTLSNGLVAYHPYLLDRGRYLLQWRWPGNRSEAFQYPDGDGRIQTPSEPASVQLAAADFHGNTATVAFDLMPKPPESAADVAGGGGTGSISLDCYGEFLVMTAAFAAAESQRPSLSVRGGSGAFFRVNDRTFRAAIAPAQHAVQLILAAEHPRCEPFAATIELFRRGDSARRVSREDITIDVPSDAPYGTLFALMQRPLKVPQHLGIEHVTDPIAIWPPRAPIDANVGLSIALPDGEARGNTLAIYRAGGSGWSRMTSNRDGNTLRASTGSFGTFAVFADETNPRVGPVTVAGPRPRPRIEVPVADDGAGIEDYEVTAGGDWLLTAYDPERNVLEWERDRDLPAAATSLAIVVTDGAGNTTRLDHPLP